MGTAATPEEDWGILGAVEPMARPARAAVRRALRRLTRVECAPELSHSLDLSLRNRLLEAAGMLFAVEIGVAAKRGLLAGETPEARFLFFCQCLREPTFAKALMGRYPTLSWRLRTLIRNWRQSTLEMLARLDADAGAVAQSIFGDGDVGALVGAAPLGDPHCGGRRVHRLDFSSGRKVIYKPRAVAMEYGATAFIRWSTSRGLLPDMIAPTVLDRAGFGWVEHMQGAGCDAAGAGRFFVRQGVNLMIAHVLGATDLHFENVLAVGEYPVIVDWETLFSPAPKHAWRGASGAALDALNTSLVRTLLLPTRVSGPGAPDEAPRSADISAIGYADHQDAPFPSLWWEQFGTDAVHLRRGFGVLPAGDCLPLVDGVRMPAAKHTDAILEGFEHAYRFYERRRRALARASGPLAVFSGAEQRHLLRPTAIYQQLLTESWHPRFAEDRRALSSHLAGRLRAEAIVNRRLERTEMRELLGGDIPYFSARVGRRAAADGKRAAVSGNGWKEGAARIATLGAVDRRRQAWIIALSMTDLSQAPPPSSARQAPLTRESMLALAQSYGDRLCETAIVRGRRASWLYPMIDNRRLIPACVGFGLYHGLPGIALFLARLWLAAGRRRHRDLALMAAAEASAIFDSNTLAVGYDGAGGLAYALAMLGAWLDEPRLSARAKAIVRRPIRLADTAIDFMSGASGFLAAACAVAAITGDRGVLDGLGGLASALCVSLPLSDADAGLAHGRAGVGFALMRWGGAAGDRRCVVVGGKLVAADARFASRARAAGVAGAGASMLAWCRGELGAAWAGLSAQGRSRFATRVVEALRVRGAAASPMCPCHGLLGQAEFLLDASRAQAPGARRVFRTYLREALGRLAAGEACSDHAHRIETPGLAMGLAGGGYTLLRLCDLDRAPNLLMLETIS